MKKLIYLPLAALALYSCDSHTYDEIGEEIIIEGPVTYNANVKSIIDNNCVMCHSQQGSASFRPLTTYSQVKAAVEEAGLLNRIQLQNGEPGVMPSTGRMPQSNIDVILEWNADGLLETE
ncbi:MAG: cytochrome c [Sphingobacteriales bacterium]|nr:MAG: cytochrome c [Sphingobacteriales bacterium]